jgi:hypothetical protein
MPAADKSPSGFRKTVALIFLVAFSWFAFNWSIDRDGTIDDRKALESRSTQWSSSFFSSKEHVRFIRLTRRILRQHGLGGKFRDNALIFDEPGDQARIGHALRLNPIALKCSGSPPDEWPGLVNHAIEQMLQVFITETFPPPGLENPDIAVNLVRVQLVSETGAGNETGSTLRQPDDNPDRMDMISIRYRIVFDLGSAIHPIDRQYLTHWDISEKDLFDATLEKTLDLYPVEKVQESFGPGLDAILMRAHHPYVATHSLTLDMHPEVIGKSGTLFMIPSSSELIAMPFDSPESINILKPLAERGFDLFTASSSPLSRNVFWHDGKQYHTIQAVHDETHRQLDLQLPPSMVELMEENKTGG